MLGLFVQERERLTVFILEQHRKIYNLANSGNIYKRQQNLSEFQGEMCLCFTPLEGGLSKNSS